MIAGEGHAAVGHTENGSPSTSWATEHLEEGQGNSLFSLDSVFRG